MVAAFHTKGLAEDDYLSIQLDNIKDVERIKDTPYRICLVEGVSDKDVKDCTKNLTGLVAVQTDSITTTVQQLEYKGDFKKEVVHLAGAQYEVLVGTGSAPFGNGDIKKLARHIGTLVKAGPKGASISIQCHAPQTKTDEFAKMFVPEVMVGLETDDRLKGKTEGVPKPAAHKRTVLFAGGKVDFTEAKRKAAAVLLAKEMVNSPPNIGFPEAYAAMMKRDSEKLKFECTIFDFKQCKDMNMGSYCSIAQGMNGCDREPQFVHMKYTNGTPKKRIAMIGKGICMDTGGVNIKSMATCIHFMHTDMGGSATVYSTFKYIVESGWKDVEVHCIAVLVENLVDANSVLPGDIVTASDGTTIEIMNTDAEGRMVMADGVIYAQKIFKENPLPNCENYVMSCATLTGAQIVALGGEIGAFYTDCPELVKAMESAHTNSVDNIWRMPLHHGYKEYLMCPRADICNLAPGVPTIPGAAGSITAALFMNHFIKLEGVKFMHLDIAGPVYDGKEATGYGPSMLTEGLRVLSNN